MDTRYIEHLFCHCPIVNCNDFERFPMASYEEFMLMEQYSYEYSDRICAFLFVREENYPERFVDVYIFDVMLYPASYERFVICDGEQLPDEREKKLLEYARNGFLIIDPEVMSRFNESVEKIFPQWHYHPYNSFSVGKAIEHIYYTSHQSGPREILFKAGLSNIALNLDKLPSYNLIGTTATTIIGSNIPLRFLRIMNKSRFIGHLFDKSDFEHCLQIYRKYSGYIGDNPTNVQWMYLDYLFSNNGLFAGRPFNRALYERLATAEGGYILNEYEAFYLLREKLGLGSSLRLPAPENIVDVVEKLNSMMFYQKKDTLLARRFQERKQNDQFYYEYSGKKYSVILPSAPDDVCMEAICQGNCVMDYIERHADRTTTILFVRRNDAPTDSFVTMEINNWQIMQIYAAYNTVPEKDVYLFLIEYAKCKALYMDTYSLIMREIDEDSDSEFDTGMRRFAESFRNKRTRPIRFQDDVTYVQMRLEDIYPWLWE